MKTAIIYKIDRNILLFLHKITDPWKMGYDVQMFYSILNSVSENDERIIFTMRIGSDSRLNNKTLPYAAFFNEFAIQIKANSNTFEMKVTLFKNDKGIFEEFNYTIDPKINDGLPDTSWIFPQENETSGPEEFFDEILLLLKQSRELRIYSQISPLKNIKMTQKQKILEAIFGTETLEQYKLVKIFKFARYEISPTEILMFVPDEVLVEAESKPDTKVFFAEDVYFTAMPDKHSMSGQFNYGIGVDPDRNAEFKPYEE